MASSRSCARRSLTCSIAAGARAAGSAAAAMFARKPCGSWRICHGYRGLNAITRPAVKSLPGPHIDVPLDGTRGSRGFTRSDQPFPSAPGAGLGQVGTSFRSRLGQFEWSVVPFGLQGASSLPMRAMNQALAVDFPGSRPASPEHAAPRQGLPPICGGVSGASGALGRRALVYMDDCLVHSPTLEQHLLNVADVLVISRRRQLCAKSSKCLFGGRNSAPSATDALQRPSRWTRASCSTFDRARRAVLTTDEDNMAIAAILTRPDDEGHQHPVAYESSKLTTAERNHPAQVLELLAAAHCLRAFRHDLPGGGALRPAGCWSNFARRRQPPWLPTLNFPQGSSKVQIP